MKQQLIIAIALLSCLAGCGSSEEERIVGHWQWAKAEALSRHPGDDAKFDEYRKSLRAECESLKEKFDMPTGIEECTNVLFAFDLQDEEIKDYKYGKSRPTG